MASLVEELKLEAYETGAYLYRVEGSDWNIEANFIRYNRTGWEGQFWIPGTDAEASIHTIVLIFNDFKDVISICEETALAYKTNLVIEYCGS